MSAKVIADSVDQYIVASPPAARPLLREELKAYKTAKGSIQLPLDQPLPVDLVRRIVEFRVSEVREVQDPQIGR